MQINNNTPGWIKADWPVAAHIRAGTTTRAGGSSKGSYRSLNLALHVGDENNNVEENRRRLRKNLHLPEEPFWLQQTHSNRIITPENITAGNQADGCYTDRGGQVCVVMTADCLPILICDKPGTEIAAVHVGWRGFSRNIIENALSCFNSTRDNLMVWMGPCISQAHYEIGTDVRDACLPIVPDAEGAFTSSRPGHWLADLKKLAGHQFIRMGLTDIYDCSFCTYTNDSLFYSYRRESVCGRTATMIWMDS